MTAIQWLTSIVGVVALVAGIAFSVWILRRWLGKSRSTRPPRLVAGIVAFLLACIVVVLVILAWQVFKAARRPHEARSQWMAANACAA